MAESPLRSITIKIIKRNELFVSFTLIKVLTNLRFRFTSYHLLHSNSISFFT